MTWQRKLWLIFVTLKKDKIINDPRGISKNEVSWGFVQNSRKIYNCVLTNIYKCDILKLISFSCSFLCNDYELRG